MDKAVLRIARDTSWSATEIAHALRALLKHCQEFNTSPERVLRMLRADGPSASLLYFHADLGFSIECGCGQNEYTQGSDVKRCEDCKGLGFIPVHLNLYPDVTLPPQRGTPGENDG
jgi:hypothetical protein